MNMLYIIMKTPVVKSYIPLLRQFDIPEIEQSDPELIELDTLENYLLKKYPFPDDFDEKTLDGLEYIAFNGRWYCSGPIR